MIYFSDSVLLPPHHISVRMAESEANQRRKRGNRNLDSSTVSRSGSPLSEAAADTQDVATDEQGWRPLTDTPSLACRSICYWGPPAGLMSIGVFKCLSPWKKTPLS